LQFSACVFESVWWGGWLLANAVTVVSTQPGAEGQKESQLCTLQAHLHHKRTSGTLASHAHLRHIRITCAPQAHLHHKRTSGTHVW